MSVKRSSSRKTLNKYFKLKILNIKETDTVTSLQLEHCSWCSKLCSVILAITIVGNWLCGNKGYVSIENKVIALIVLLII